MAHLHCWRFFARMFSKSKRFGDNVHAASGPGPVSKSRFTLYVAGPGTFNEGYQDAVVVNIFAPSLQQCRSCGAGLALGLDCTSGHHTPQFCHHLQCHSWEVKLIDSMSLTSHECDSLTLMQRRNFRSTC